MKNPVTAGALALCAVLAAAPAPAQVTATRDPVGDVLSNLLPIAAGALTFYNDDREGLKQLAYSFALSQGTTEVLKHAVNRRRPDGTGHGFPSGHTSSAFASAAFVHARYGVTQSIPFYALATVTAYERVHTHHHFTGQVVAGAAVGIASSFLLTQSRDGRSGAAIGYGPEGITLEYATRW
jgi:membrane-associated phospholipid phosphatase